MDLYLPAKVGARVPCRADVSVASMHAGVKGADIPTPKQNSAWLVDFDTWSQSSSGYAGVDADMRMRMKTVYFFANRPTIAALMGLGTDIAAAFKTGSDEVGASLSVARFYSLPLVIPVIQHLPFNVCSP